MTPRAAARAAAVVKLSARIARATGLARPRRRKPLPVDPLESAKLAELRYVDDHGPGIRRVARGKGFAFLRPDGSPVRDAPTLRRIRSLVIPPAWTNVWICPSPEGHIQATGRDARGRKQYRYHARFREIRDETKYERMLAFAEALPRIRAAVDEHLSLPKLSREKVLATVVRLLEITLIRIGNEEYARENESFGLTTLRTRHVDVTGSSVRFHFRGKSGKEHLVEVHDRRVARIVSRITDLPGEILFQYIDDDGNRCTVESSDVNAYLRAISGADFTAKDFRTWAGTVLCAKALRKLVSEEVRSQTALKKNVAQAVKDVAARLGNTAAVCRKCYVHPEVLGAYLEGALALSAKADAAGGPANAVTGVDAPALPPDEAAVLALIRERLARSRRARADRREPEAA